MFTLKLICVCVVIDTLYFFNKVSKTKEVCVIVFSMHNLKHILGAIHKCQHFHECTNHTLWVWFYEKQHFFNKLFTFWSDFYYFHGDFWHSKNVDVYSFWGGESIWFVHS